MTTTFLSRPEVAARIGVAVDSIHGSGYTLPEPDAMIGRLPGWLPATIDAWNAARPGRGRWGTRAGSPDFRGTTFTCPRCNVTSAHPDDVAQGYCGRCHDWTGGEAAQ